MVAWNCGSVYCTSAQVSTHVSIMQVGHLLGVSYSEKVADAVRTSVAGFAWVQQVNLEDNSIALMCPHATPPPTLTFIFCSVKRRLDLTEL
jgi:hypothetical protein